ncbi:hypothetical protein [Streptomyces sp. NPDC046979]|uniref:hypothetical protein n=1 Tax=Streptomyces sp. NPDC046979 TaxID=3154604 RepID=UPI0033CA8702
MEPAELLARHGIDPARLAVAPKPPARAQTLDRVLAMPPWCCSLCGEEARTAHAVVLPVAGPRWVDLCGEHHLAVMRRLPPMTSVQILDGLRDAAAEAGVSRRIITDRPEPAR